jgi:hypothetical protein
MEALGLVHQSKVRFKITSKIENLHTLLPREELSAVDIGTLRSASPTLTLESIAMRAECQRSHDRGPKFMKVPEPNKTLSPQISFPCHTPQEMRRRHDPPSQVKCTIFECAGRSRDRPPGGSSEHGQCSAFLNLDCGQKLAIRYLLPFGGRVVNNMSIERLSSNDLET